MRLSLEQCAQLTLTSDVAWDRDFGSGCASCVAMMQPPDHREGDDVAPIVGFALTRMRRRCCSPRTMTWSKHSRRRVPITRSQYGFCHGDRCAVRTAEKRRMKLYGRNHPSEKRPA